MSPIPSITEKKLAEFDEAVEISKEILKKKNSSSRSKITPVLNEKMLGTQNSIISKSESTKSFHLKDSYELALEDKFKDFLKTKKIEGVSNIGIRIQLLDEFERKIRDEIRDKFLFRVIEEKALEDEIRKAKFEIN